MSAERASAVDEAPFDLIIVDKRQDISALQLRFLDARRGNEPDGLFLAADLGQRIFQTLFFWCLLGDDVRCRSSWLQITNRTSRKLRCQADHLLPPELSDVDGKPKFRQGTVSALDGPVLTNPWLDAQEDKTAGVAEWLSEMQSQGMLAQETGIFVRISD